MRFEVDSRFRTSGTNEDYTYKVRTEVSNLRGFRLNQVTVPQTMYSIITGYNDSFKVYFSPSDAALPQPYQYALITIPGNKEYTDDELGAEIVAQVAASIAAPYMVMTYDATTKQLSFTNPDSGVVAGQSGIPSVPRQWTNEVTADGLPWTVRGRFGAWMLGLDATIGIGQNLADSEFDVGLAADGGILSATLPLPINQAPGSTLLMLRIGEASGASGTSVRNAGSDASYSVPMEATYGYYQTMTTNESYEQVVSIPEDGLDELRIQWFPADPELTPYFSFSGVPHHLSLEVIEY